MKTYWCETFQRTCFSQSSLPLAVTIHVHSTWRSITAKMRKGSISEDAGDMLNGLATSVAIRGISTFQSQIASAKNLGKQNYSSKALQRQHWGIFRGQGQWVLQVFCHLENKRWLVAIAWALWVCVELRSRKMDTGCSCSWRLNQSLFSEKQIFLKTPRCCKANMIFHLPSVGSGRVLDSEGVAKFFQKGNCIAQSKVPKLYGKCAVRFDTVPVQFPSWNIAGDGRSSPNLLLGRRRQGNSWSNI